MNPKLTALALFAFVLISCQKTLLHTANSLNAINQLNFKIGTTGVTLESAAQLAKAFLAMKSPMVSVRIRNQQTIISNGIPYFHVINTNAGFMILSADSLYEPILAYDSTGNFSLMKTSIGPGLSMWLNKHVHEMDFIRRTRNTYTDSIGRSNKAIWKGMVSSSAAVKISSSAVAIPDVPPATLISSVPAYLTTNSTVGPLCQTLWGQDFPFNYYCPTSTTLNNTNYDGYDPDGCTPLAVAQVMYFWKFPSATPAYSTLPPLMAPFLYPTSLNWAVMPLTKQSANPASDGGMAKLIRDIGTILGTTYAPSGSGTSDGTSPNIAFAVMGYSAYSETSSVSSQQLSGANDGITFAGLLTNEIQNNKRPCIITGFSGYNNVGCCGILPYPGGDGHSWVCDGSNVTNYYSGVTNTYKTYYGQIYSQTTYTSETTLSLLHMNWGWEDLYVVGEDDQSSILLTNNGWYNCGVNYTQSGTNSGDENFQYFQVVDYGIHP